MGAASAQPVQTLGRVWEVAILLLLVNINLASLRGRHFTKHFAWHHGSSPLWDEEARTQRNACSCPGVSLYHWVVGGPFKKIGKTFKPFAGENCWARCLCCSCWPRVWSFLDMQCSAFFSWSEIVYSLKRVLYSYQYAKHSGGLTEMTWQLGLWHIP